MKETRLIFVCGNDGSGKSTLANLVAGVPMDIKF